jgi:hypothetical protein
MYDINRRQASAAFSNGVNAWIEFSAAGDSPRSMNLLLHAGVVKTGKKRETDTWSASPLYLPVERETPVCAH